MVVEFTSTIIESFVLGLLTPLTAVCVLPLYPGFLIYLSNQSKKQDENKIKIAFLGLLVSAGVITFMTLFGLLFTTILKTSLTAVIGIISPIAFGILGVISLFLIFDVDIGRYFPKIQTPFVKNPYLGAFVFGLFFGAIVIPCNPLFIAVLFTRTLTAISFAENMVRFLFFGIGMAFPLLVLSIVSSSHSRIIIAYLTKNKRKINLFSGLMILVISVYYLVFVFRLLG